MASQPEPGDGAGTVPGSPSTESSGHPVLNVSVSLGPSLALPRPRGPHLSLLLSVSASVSLCDPLTLPFSPPSSVPTHFCVYPYLCLLLSPMFFLLLCLCSARLSLSLSSVSWASFKTAEVTELRSWALWDSVSVAETQRECVSAGRLGWVGPGRDPALRLGITSQVGRDLQGKEKEAEKEPGPARVPSPGRRKPPPDFCLRSTAADAQFKSQPSVLP